MSSRKAEIIASAIKLFNENSCSKTTTRHICLDLNISVGNLYYYFKSKEEILICIYESFMNELGALLTDIGENKNSPFDYYNFLLSQIEFEYTYRFLRLEMSTLIVKYLKLKEAFEEGLKIKITQLKNLYKHEMKYGYLNTLDEDEIDFFVSNIWIIGSQWEIYWILKSNDTEKNRRKNGLLNLLYFIKPYLSKKGLKDTNLLSSILYVKKEDNVSL